MSLLASLLQIIKQAAIEAVEASEPSTFLFGTVIGEKPLQVQIEQKTILTEPFLILTNNVRNHGLKVEGYSETDEAGVRTFADKEEKVLQVKNVLKTGDQVILIKQKGGQKFIVLDRIKEDKS